VSRSDPDLDALAAEWTANVRPQIRSTDNVINVSGTSVEAVKQAAAEYGIDLDDSEIIDNRHTHYAGPRNERVSCDDERAGCRVAHPTHPS